MFLLRYVSGNLKQPVDLSSILKKQRRSTKVKTSNFTEARINYIPVVVHDITFPDVFEVILTLSTLKVPTPNHQEKWLLHSQEDKIQSGKRKKICEVIRICAKTFTPVLLVPRYRWVPVANLDWYPAESDEMWGPSTYSRARKYGIST